MSHPTELSKDLNVEDFRRLGVRPNEVRLSVIRGAASRNAMPLANQLLDSPNDNGGGDESWLQLSRVVTSTYRLLDPRLRPNAHQRAYIGRILPLALSVAGTTGFQTNEPRTGKYGDEQRSLAFGNSDLGVVPPPVSDVFRTSEITSEKFSQPSTQLSDAEIWELSLDDRDLVSGSRLRRSRTATNRNLWVWSSLATCGALVGAILGWNSLGGKTDLIAATDQHQPVAIQLPLSHQAQPNKIQQSVASLTEPAQPVREQPRASDHSAFDHSDIKPSELETSERGPSGREPELPIASLPVTNDFLPIDPSSIHALDAVVETAADVVEESDQSKVPTTMEPPLQIAEVETETNEALPSVEQGLFPCPNPEDVAIARRRLLQSIDAPSVTITSVNFKTVRDSIVDAQSRFSPGSVDHFTAASMLGSFAWLESGPRHPSFSTITSLLDAYQVDETNVWTQSYIDASEHVTLPEDLKQFFTAGFGLIESLITREAFDQASQVLTLIQQRSEQFAADQSGIEATNGNRLKTLIASYKKSIQYADRTSTTALRVIRLHGDIESIPTDISGGSSLGRHYCLVLGNWSQGLRFLAQTSDPRLAALAKSELELLTVDPFYVDPISWTEMAYQWQIAADRLSGRSANQIRLHAIDLLKRSSQRATKVAKLNTGQRMDAILDQLPMHLKLEQESAVAKTVVAVAATGEIAIAKSSPTSRAPSKKEPTVASDLKLANDWLSGRITDEGEDLGISLHYQLDVSINQTMLQSIEKQLRQPLENAVIEFEGDFNCEAEQLVMLALSKPSETVSETVFLDGEPIELDPLDHSTRLLIPAGDHSLRWSIALMDTQSTISCSLRDARTSQRLRLTTSPKHVDAASTGDLTVSVMRSGD